MEIFKPPAYNKAHGSAVANSTIACDLLHEFPEQFTKEISKQIDWAANFSSHLGVCQIPNYKNESKIS